MSDYCPYKARELDPDRYIRPVWEGQDNVHCGGDLPPGNGPTIEYDELQRRDAERSAKEDAACAKWSDGECCGEHAQRRDDGWCRLAFAPCYQHPDGLENAKQYWDAIEQASNLISPWRRAQNVADFIRESAI